MFGNNMTNVDLKSWPLTKREYILSTKKNLLAFKYANTIDGSFHCSIGFGAFICHLH